MEKNTAQTKEQALELMHEAHKVLLREMDRICSQNHLRFFMESGTLLGAVRHKDAIPWDDDMDTVMFRSDYERFRSIVREKLSEEFLFVEPEDYGEKVVYDYIPRLVMKDSVTKKDSPEEQYHGNGLHNHAVLDIFIMDDVPDNNLLWIFMKGALFFVYGLGMGHRFQLHFQEYKGLSKVIVYILSRLGKLVKPKTIFRWYSRICQWGAGKNAKKGRCFSGNLPPQLMTLVFQKEWYEKTVRLPYGNDSFPAPAGYHAVLTTLYHDYMKFPPEESRKLYHCQVGYVNIWHPDVLKKFPPSL